MGTIGIIGAMEVEVKELKEQMQITRQLTKAGMEFCEGILEGQDVVVVRSGVGKVNAAVCTQILIDVFDVKAVINTGIAAFPPYGSCLPMITFPSEITEIPVVEAPMLTTILPVWARTGIPMPTASATPFSTRAILLTFSPVSTL